MYERVPSRRLVAVPNARRRRVVPFGSAKTPEQQQADMIGGLVGIGTIALLFIVFPIMAGQKSAKRSRR